MGSPQTLARHRPRTTHPTARRHLGTHLRANRTQEPIKNPARSAGAVDPASNRVVEHRGQSLRSLTCRESADAGRPEGRRGSPGSCAGRRDLPWGGAGGQRARREAAPATGLAARWGFGARVFEEEPPNEAGRQGRGSERLVALLLCEMFLFSRSLAV
jgi:hypothetical protein